MLRAPAAAGGIDLLARQVASEAIVAVDAEKLHRLEQHLLRARPNVVEHARLPSRCVRRPQNHLLTGFEHLVEDVPITVELKN